MKNRIFTTFIFLALFSIANAQDTLYDAQIDEETYQYYLDKDWDKLIQVGLEAKDTGINFYYLNLRIGFAYYNKKNYRRAIPFFKQATDKNPINIEYLYFAYLFSGRENDAIICAKTMSEEKRVKNNINPKPVFSKMHIEGDYLFNSETDKLQNIDIDGVDNIYGENLFITNHKHFTFGLETNIGDRIILNYSFSNFLMNQNQTISSYETVNNYKTSNLQQQYYVNLNYHFAESYDLSIAFNILNIKTSTNIFTQNYSYTNLTEHNTYDIFDTVYQADAILNVYDTIQSYNEIITHTISDSTSKWLDMIFAISVWKDINQFKIGLHGNYSKLNNISFLQTGATLVYFPLGNLNLYSRTDIITKLDFLDKNNAKIRPGFYINQLIGVKVLENLWTEGFYSYGVMSNFSSNDAFLVYNTGEKINQTGGINLSYLMFKQSLKINLSCVFMQKEYSYLTYVFDSNVEQTFQGIRHESYTYDDNSVYWTDPQNIEIVETKPTYLPVNNTVKYISCNFSIGLSYNF